MDKINFHINPRSTLQLNVFIISIVFLFVTLLLSACWRKPKGPPRPEGDTTLLSYSNIKEAWTYSTGRGIIVAVMDWQFDPDASFQQLYVSPTSLIPSEKMGNLNPWHGSWMLSIVHAVAPEASLMPIIARSLNQDYKETLPLGIRYAADHGASVVTSSMGPMYNNQKLREAVEYALAKSCIFVDVHPEIVVEANAKPRPCRRGECLETVIHSAIISVPAHLLEPDEARDIYVWPYDLDSSYQDGWGYSNAPPTVAGVIALMLSANRSLPIGEVKRLLIESADMRNGFRVLNAEAAVRMALALAKTGS